MSAPLDRRRFLGATAFALAALPTRGLTSSWPQSGEPWFRISLAQWSLHRALFDDGLDHLDFIRETRRTYDIDAVEYVNVFFFERARDTAYLDEMNRVADGEGVRQLLIMCDRVGQLGARDERERSEAVEGHREWLEAAAHLGCHSIRVNAASEGEREEQSRLAADGLGQLADIAAPMELNVLVENHGGLSSDASWLATTITRADRPNLGTLPDFGNFRIEGDRWYDIYRGTEELMPHARAVSAKSHAFDDRGNETEKDYLRLLRIVRDSGYRGWVGVEYEGNAHSEPEGIRATKALLERVRDELAPED